MSEVAGPNLLQQSLKAHSEIDIDEWSEAQGIADFVQQRAKLPEILAL
eukprot:CAMPEP_0197694766 /NCGR_PEP_ID=MMETSP1338-20131121/114258_1 /TAXON_ID=43686 ORGANISM="Pelagodinium beii, Strain RCC1491" /NCGR_SAMPLE_ID=MMETSP1338 /ASSEMBLY_ACC=CAM_ASM_000754 /LENGTH=47 /DNA_ID= /DNA_START= /DNA_END= /DNA_ORIENTATION=